MKLINGGAKCESDGGVRGTYKLDSDQ